MKRLGLTLFAILSIFMAKAQLVNVCGTDTIVLQVENYQNGIIEWQESIDTINWVNIPEISGETYKFYPSQTKYYRAVVKTTDCSPLYSAISFVQLPPVAYAGADQVIGTTSTTLLGNDVAGAAGEWTIIAGEGGLLDNTSNPWSLLTGINDEKYSLVWTLVNACGQSSDTVDITFDKIVAINKFIVVDNTDSIYSDSTEIANGVYRIKFGDPTIAPFDSVLLIAMREDISFLRKVNAFSLQDSIYTFSTTQGTFQDLFESGVLNMGDAVNQALTLEPSDLKNELLFPTRQTLRENSENNGIKLLYVNTINSESFKETKAGTNSTDLTGLTLNIDDVTLFRSPGDLITLSIKDAYIKIKPRFVLDYEFSHPATLTNLRLGVDNAEFEYNFSIELLSEQAANWNETKTILKLKKHIIFMVGLVPVDIVAKFEIKATCNLSMAASIKLEETKNYKINLTALVEGDDAKNLILNYKSPVLTSTNKVNFIKQGELSSEFKIGPEISFLAYGIVGPYLKLPAKINMAVCANSDLNWKANASIGFEGYLGASADIVIEKTWLTPGMSLNLFRFEKSLFNNAFTKHIKMPFKLELLSGNYQSGNAGETLGQPISIKVVSNLGFGIPLVPVRFDSESNNGYVSQGVKLTNGQGIVTTDWTLGTNPTNKLKVSVLNCDNNDIENSPLFIYANTTSQPYNCTNSNLSINLKTSQGNMFPSVSGGSPPYKYSKTGLDYSNTLPLFNVLVPGNYIVFVRDNNQCIKTRSFEIEPNNLCANSNLWIDVLVQPNILKLTGKNGKSPYQFAVDNKSNYSTSDTYYQMTAGKHIIYMKDANGCEASTEITINNLTNSSIRSSFPLDGSTSVPVSGFTFQWAAATYTTNQVYDLYLKKGTDTYSLIASGLSNTSYTYSTALLASTTYNWKIAVKGSNGAVIDFSEFTFTTASGIATTPTIPVLIQPTNGATSVGLPITFKWTAQAGDFKYDLYLDETNASRLIANNLSQAGYTIKNLVCGKTYYWKVKIKSTITGESVVSDIYSFSTRNTGCEQFNGKIGDTYGGGIVGYILQVGDPGYIEGEKHGLIVTFDTKKYFQWGCDNLIIASWAREIGAGNNNTIRIDALCTTSGIAADYCVNLSIDGYTDWYLPSINELKGIFKNKDAIGYNSQWSNGGIWSSTEYNKWNALYLTNDYGVERVGHKTGKQLHVFAVRSF